MPRRDGNGPAGAGPMSGRGLGHCARVNAADGGAGRGMRRGFGRGRGRGGGLGLGFGRGFGRGFAAGRLSAGTQKERLEEQKNMLQSRLEAVDRRLEGL